MSEIIRFEGVDKRYGEQWAARGLEFGVREGERFILIGESGSGKTTALRMINRLVEPDAGVIRVLGEDTNLSDAAALRRNIGYVIQEVGLFAHYTVRENISVVPRLLGWQKARIAERVEELLGLVGLSPADFAGRYPSQLSGGQRQRVGIARALAADPPLVLLDEPFGALDPLTRSALQDEFLALSRRLKKTFVLVTHDMLEAVRLADRIAVFDKGQLVGLGTPSELLEHRGEGSVTSLLGGQRLQLRLMSISLSVVLERLGEVSEPGATDGPEITREHSLWDALQLLEQHGREQLIVHGEPSRSVSREQLWRVGGSLV